MVNDQNGHFHFPLIAKLSFVCVHIKSARKRYLFNLIRFEEEILIHRDENDEFSPSVE